MIAHLHRVKRRIHATAIQMVETLESRAYLSSIGGVVLGTPIDTPAAANNMSPVVANSADFTGNGRDDLYVANQNDTVSVLLSNVDGSFQTPINSYAVSGTPLSLATGQFTSSGHLDIATGTIGTGGAHGDVSILVGNGDGTFQPAINILALQSNFAIAVGNFVTGGPLDIISASDSPSNVNNVCLTITDGTGHLASQTFFSTPFGTVSSIAVGDFGNGHEDFAVSNRMSNSVTVYLGNGDGTFQTPATYPTGPAPTSVVAGQFDVSGNIGLVTADSAGGEVSFLANNGNGTFAAPVNSPVPGSANNGGPLTASLGNFVSDSEQDLVCLLSPGSIHDATILLDNNNGTFRTGALINTGGGTRYAAIGADLTGPINGTVYPGVVLSGLTELTVIPNITFDDTSTPIAVVNASQGAATVGATTYDFVVTYTDQYQINAATLGNGNLTVTLPGGTQEAATLVSENLGNAASVQATYQITVPELTIAQSGQTYEVEINANSVQNADGVAVAAGSIGSFNLAVNSAIYTPPAGVFSLGALKGKIRSSIISGTKQKSPISVKVTNTSSSPITGTVAVTLYQSSTQYNDDNSPATSIAVEAAVNKKMKNLKVGKSFVIHFKPFTYTTVGTEYLIAEAELNGSVNSDDSASPAITVVEPYVDAHVLSAQLGKSHIVDGANFPVTLMLQNTGNIEIKAATAFVAVALVPPGGGASAMIAPAVPLHLTLRPSQTKKFRIKFRPSTLPTTGIYQLSLTLTLTDDNDSADKFVTALGTVTI